MNEPDEHHHPWAEIVALRSDVLSGEGLCFSKTMIISPSIACRMSSGYCPPDERSVSGAR